MRSTVSSIEMDTFKSEEDDPLGQSTMMNAKDSNRHFANPGDQASNLKRKPYCKRITIQDGYLKSLADIELIETVIPLLAKLWFEDGSKDVSLISSEGLATRCHSSILSCASPFLSKMLSDSSDCTAIRLPDTRHVTVEAFAKQMYCLESEQEYDLGDMRDLIKTL